VHLSELELTLSLGTEETGSNDVSRVAFLFRMLISLAKQAMLFFFFIFL
jgi:hypothetical protein